MRFLLVYFGASALILGALALLAIYVLLANDIGCQCEHGG